MENFRGIKFLSMRPRAKVSIGKISGYTVMSLFTYTYVHVYLSRVCAERSLKNTPTKSSKKRSAGSNAGIIN